MPVASKKRTTPVSELVGSYSTVQLPPGFTLVEGWGGASLPAGTHNAQPFADGVLFNDTQADRVRFASRNPDNDRAFKVPVIPNDKLTGLGYDDSKVARAGFGRGLCTLGNGLVAAGSSPSTIAIHDLKSGKTPLSVTISSDIRNAIHGLEVWPF